MSTAVENVLKEDENLSAGDIANIAKFINDLNFALIEKYGVDFKPGNLGLLTNGPLEAISIPLNYQDGDTFSLAVAKAVIAVGIGVGVGVAIAGGGIVATVGGALAFGYYFGDVISDAVEDGYDFIIGPDFEFDNFRKILTVDYTTYEALTATAGLVFGETLEQTIKKYNLENWKLHSTHSNGGPDIEYIKSSNTYKIELSLEQARNESKDYIEALFEFSGEAEFKLEVNNGIFEALNLKNKSQSTLASLAKNDEIFMHALENLKSYALEGDSAGIVDRSDAQINDLAGMLYSHLHPEYNDGYAYYNRQNGENVAYHSVLNEIEFGSNSGETLNGFQGNDRLSSFPTSSLGMHMKTSM